MAKNADLSLFFGFRIDTSGFSKGLKDAEKQLNAFADKAASIAAPTAAVGAALTAAAAGFLAFEKSQTDAIKGAQDAAQSAGLSTAAYMQMRAVFSDLVGGSEAFSAGVGKLNVLMGEAAQGSAAAQAKLAQFGILSTDSTEQAIAKVADKIAAAGSSGERAALAVDAFGKSGKDLVPILAQGSAALGQMRNDAVASGQALNSQDIAVAVGLWGQFDAIGDQFEGALQKLAVTAAPLASMMLDIGQSIIEGFAGSMPYIEAFIIEISPLFTNFRENILLGFIKFGETLVNILIAPFRIIAGGIATILDGIVVGIAETIRGAAELAAKALDAIGADEKAAKMRQMGDSFANGINSATQGLHDAAESLVNGKGITLFGDIQAQIARDNEEEKAKLEKLFADKRNTLAEKGKAAELPKAAAPQLDPAKLLAQSSWAKLGKGVFNSFAGMAESWTADNLQFDAEPEKKQASEARFADLVTRGSQDAFRALQGTKQDEQVSVLKSIDKTLKDTAKKTTGPNMSLATVEV